MLDVLKFIFDDGWHFSGIVVVLYMVLDGIADIVKASRKADK
jgi:hypothetical protein